MRALITIVFKNQKQSTYIQEMELRRTHAGMVVLGWGIDDECG